MSDDISILKEELEKIFGKEVFKDNDSVSSFEDACKISGEDPKAVERALSNIPIDVLSKSDRDYLINHYKLVKSIEVVNQGWKPNMEDPNERKYFGALIHKIGAGFVFYYALYFYTAATAGLGSRLYFKDDKKAENGTKNLIKLFNANHKL